MSKNKNIMHRNYVEVSFKANRLAFQDRDKTPYETDPRLHQPISSEKNKLLADHLKRDTMEKLDNLNKSAIFGPIFKQMLDDHVQFQDWSGDTSMAERDMRKYFDNANVPAKVRKLWFDPKDGIFAKLSHPPTSIPHKEGLAALEAFKMVLVNDHLKDAQDMVKSENEAATKGPVLDKGRALIDNVVEGFKNGDATDKIIMVTAGYMLFQGLGKLRKKNFPGSDSLTWGDIMTYGAAYLGANLVAIKATGKSLGEHLGLSDPKSKFNKTEYEKFARAYNIKDGKEMELMLRMGDANMETLYNLYKDPQTDQSGTIKWIDPYAAGIDTDITDDKSRRERGMRMYKAINALVDKAGGRQQFEKKYINRKLVVKDSKGKATSKKVDWNFRTVAWDIMRNEELRIGMSTMEMIWVRAKKTVMGREEMPFDGAQIHEEFPWPEHWSVKVMKQDDKEGDGKIEVKINGVLMVAERSEKMDPLSGHKKKLIHYKLTIKGTNVSKGMYIREKDGKAQFKPKEIKAVDSILEKEMHKRITGSTFISGPPAVALRDKIRWSVDDRAWVYKKVSLPALPAYGAPAISNGTIKATASRSGGVHIQVLGGPRNLNLTLEASKEGHLKDRIKFMIFNQVSPKKDFSGLRGLEGYVTTTILNTTPRQVELRIGKAMLPLTYNTGTKQWEVYARAGGPGASKLEQQFASDPDVANALGDLESLDRNSDLNRAINAMKDIFKAMPESFFQHGFGKFLDIFRKFNINSPSSSAAEFVESGSSGSINERYAFAMAKYKKEEIANMYKYALKDAKSLADLETIKANVLYKAINDITQINGQLKMESNIKRQAGDSVDEAKFHNAMEQYLRVGYRSTFYQNTMLEFARNTYNMDKRGMDKSDWSKYPHAVQAKMMQVVAVRTKAAAANKDLDNTDFVAMRRRKESIENRHGYKRTKPASDPVNVSALRTSMADPLWQAANKEEKKREANWHQQAYVTYVVNQVTHKAHVFADEDAALDETLSRIPGPFSSSWEIMDEALFIEKGGRVPQLQEMYKQLPKLKRKAIIQRMDKAIDSVVYDLQRDEEYDDALIEQGGKDIKTGAAKNEVDYKEVVKMIMKAPNRADQEMLLQAFKEAVRDALKDEANKSNVPKHKSIWYRVKRKLKEWKYYIFGN